MGTAAFTAMLEAAIFYAAGYNIIQSKIALEFGLDLGQRFPAGHAVACRFSAQEAD